MGLEIELKARVNYPEAIKEKLINKALFVGEYHKKDIYFTSEKVFPLSLFRLRNEGKALVTLKKKIINDGIETNTEIEFSVDDEQMFLRFAGALDFRELYRKEKIGQAWQLGAVKVEIGTVTLIGHFVELEIILDETASTEKIQQAKMNLKYVLSELGIPVSAIEEKSYSQLIQEAQDLALSQ